MNLKIIDPRWAIPKSHIFFSDKSHFQVSLLYTQGFCNNVLAWSVVSKSLGSHGLYPSRLFCPLDFPGKNTAVDCCFLLQRIFWIQGLNPYVLHLLHWQAASLPLCQPSGKVLCNKHLLGNFQRLHTAFLISQIHLTSLDLPDPMTWGLDSFLYRVEPPTEPILVPRLTWNWQPYKSNENALENFSLA